MDKAVIFPVFPVFSADVQYAAVFAWFSVSFAPSPFLIAPSWIGTRVFLNRAFRLGGRLVAGAECRAKKEGQGWSVRVVGCVAFSTLPTSMCYGGGSLTERNAWKHTSKVVDQTTFSVENQHFPTPGRPRHRCSPSRLDDTTHPSPPQPPRLG